MTDEIQEILWITHLFDGFVLCDEVEEKVEESSESWRGCLEDAEIKIRRSKI